MLQTWRCRELFKIISVNLVLELVLGEILECAYNTAGKLVEIQIDALDLGWVYAFVTTLR